MRNHCELKKKLKIILNFIKFSDKKIVINKQYHNYKRKNIYIFTFEIFNLNIQTNIPCTSSNDKKKSCMHVENCKKKNKKYQYMTGYHEVVT